MINSPDYIREITPFIDKPLVKILSGVRRCGKSTIFEILHDELIRDGVYGVTVALKGNTIGHNALKDIAGVPKLVPEDHQMVNIARNIGICFGD